MVTTEPAPPYAAPSEVFLRSKKLRFPQFMSPRNLACPDGKVHRNGAVGAVTGAP